jgi:hypothetical protein
MIKYEPVTCNRAGTRLDDNSDIRSQYSRIFVISASSVRIATSLSLASIL